MYKFFPNPVTYINSWFYFYLAESPFGHIPVLSVNGTEVCGSVNIARFIAERHGKIFWYMDYNRGSYIAIGDSIVKLRVHHAGNA